MTRARAMAAIPLVPYFAILLFRNFPITAAPEIRKSAILARHSGLIPREDAGKTGIVITGSGADQEPGRPILGDPE